MFLLDTDTCIFLMKGHAGAIRHFRKQHPKHVFVSVISHHELLYGALHSAAPDRHLQKVREFLSPLTVLPFTGASALQSARTRELLASVGKPIGPLDTLIAGHAVEHDLTLVTSNTSEFSRVAGLALEIWT